MPAFDRPVRDAPARETFDNWVADLGFKDADILGASAGVQTVRRRSTRTRRTVATHQPISVLFVDDRNRVRSVIAHAQAEITRIWTLNQRGYNLFSNIDSAGLHVDSSLTRHGSWTNHRAGEPALEPALEATLGQPQYKEGQDLLQRFQDKHATRGIDYADFDNFDYILAFDEATLTDLRNLEWAAYHRARRLGRDGLRARTKYIGEFNTRRSGPVRIPKPESSNGRAPHRRDFDATTRLVEQELQNFLHVVTGWARAERVAVDALATRYRSRQFLARATRVTDAKMRTIWLLHDKRVMVDEEVAGRGYRTVTITAKEGNELREALEDARRAFL